MNFPSSVKMPLFSAVSIFEQSHVAEYSLFWGLFADVELSHLPWCHKCGFDSADPSVPPSVPGFPQSGYRLVEKEEA